MKMKNKKMLFINRPVVILFIAFILACNSLQALTDVVSGNMQGYSHDLDLIFDQNEGDPDNGAALHLANKSGQIITPENIQHIEAAQQFGNGTVDYIAWSPDGKLFAPRNFDGNIKLWDAKNFTNESIIDDNKRHGERIFFPLFFGAADITEDHIVIIPEPIQYIKINIDTLGQDLPNSKADGWLNVMLTLTVDDDIYLETYGQIKVQGSSTAYWPKKNWSLSFYSDAERSEKIKIQIGNSIPSDMWIAKADWIDPTQMRNIISYKLWREMVESRTGEIKYEVDNAWINPEDIGKGGQGFPFTYMTIVNVNEEHYGISTLILGHDPNNFNIDKNNDKHVYMEFDGRLGDPEKRWSKFSSEGIGTCINGYLPKNDDFTDNQIIAIDRLGQFLNSSQENFAHYFHDYLDKTNMIDMLLFIEMLYDWDAVASDIEIVTYDLEKWYFLPWDKDTTFGLFFDGTGVMEGSEIKLVIDYKVERDSSIPWYKTYHSYKDDVEERYKELRDFGVFSKENFEKMLEESSNRIPDHIWDLEREKWEPKGRPYDDDLTFDQILEWTEKRLIMLDEHFNYQHHHQHHLFMPIFYFQLNDISAQ